MKTSVSSLELKYVLDELKFMIGGKIDQIYHPAKKELILQIHVPNKGKSMIRAVAGKILFLADEKPAAEEPDGFCVFLRKTLINARIIDIAQIDAERIVKFEFNEFNLYLELYGKGNFILCNKENKIIGVEERYEFADRVIAKDEIYRHPKREYTYNDINAEKFALVMDEMKQELVKALATGLGLGGTFAEEICLISGVDKDKKELTKQELDKVIKALNEVVKRKAGPVLLKKDGKVKEILPFKLEIYKDLEQEKVESLNFALSTFYSKQLADEAMERGLKSYNDKLKKLETVVDEQRKTVEKYKKEYDKNMQVAEKIYSNYQVISEILEELKNAKKKFSNEEINEKLKAHKVVKEVTKEGKVKIVVD